MFKTTLLYLLRDLLNRYRPGDVLAEPDAELIRRTGRLSKFLKLVISDDDQVKIVTKPGGKAFAFVKPKGDLVLDHVGLMKKLPNRELLW